MFKSTRIKCAPIIFNFSLTARLRKKLSTLSAMLRYKKKQLLENICIILTSIIIIPFIMIQVFIEFS